MDLDPYGTPSMLLDSAVQSVAEGGILMVTATDMAVLCGNNGETCWTKYGSYPIHRPYCHEMGLRILLGCIEQHASRWGAGAEEEEEAVREISLKCIIVTAKQCVRHWPAACWRWQSRWQCWEALGP